MNNTIIHPLSRVCCIDLWRSCVIFNCFFVFVFQNCQYLYICIVENFPSSSHSLHPLCCMLGKKRAWIPDEKEAYIEIEIKELSGDKVIVETKDGRVSDHRFTFSNKTDKPPRQCVHSTIPCSPPHVCLSTI